MYLLHMYISIYCISIYCICIYMYMLPHICIGYHMKCLDTALDSVPDGKWECDVCAENTIPICSQTDPMLINQVDELAGAFM